MLGQIGAGDVCALGTIVQYNCIALKSNSVAGGINPLNCEHSMEQEQLDTTTELLELSTEIVTAYVSHNVVPTAELPELIANVYGAMKATQAEAVEAREPLKPAVSVRRSITDDYLICLEDGKKFKSLKRHLRTHYGLSPEEYREKWSLPADYPMVAPNYAAARSQLAKKMGLGQRGGRRKAA